MRIPVGHAGAHGSTAEITRQIARELTEDPAIASAGS